MLYQQISIIGKVRMTYGSSYYSSRLQVHAKPQLAISMLWSRRHIVKKRGEPEGEVSKVDRCGIKPKTPNSNQEPMQE